MHKQKDKRRTWGGFTLIEIMIGVVAMGILAAMLAPTAGRLIESYQYSGEWDVLRSIEKDIKDSWSNQAQSQNFGMMSGQTGVTAPTAFDAETNINTTMAQTLTISSANDWRVKDAAMRNMTVSLPQTIYHDSAALAQVAFNGRYWSRILIAGPTTETVQRYILMSVMTPASRQLKFPVSTTSGQVFDTIWNNAWNSATASAPTSWASMTSGSFSASDYALWNTVSAGNRTNAGRLFVIQITQKKYIVTAVNTSTTTNLEVDIGPYANAITIAANASTPVVSCTTIPEFANGVPEGRWIVVRMGTSGNMKQVQAYPLTGPSTVTVQ